MQGLMTFCLDELLICPVELTVSPVRLKLIGFLSNKNNVMHLITFHVISCMITFSCMAYTVTAAEHWLPFLGLISMVPYYSNKKNSLRDIA